MKATNKNVIDDVGNDVDSIIKSLEFSHLKPNILMVTDDVHHSSVIVCFKDLHPRPDPRRNEHEVHRAQCHL